MLALPVNVKDIISGHTVEWERIEYTIEFPIHTVFKETGDIRKDTGQPESTRKVGERVLKILYFCRKPSSKQEILSSLWLAAVEEIVNRVCFTMQHVDCH